MNERGAIVIHTALALLALTFVSALVVDRGLVWVARSQAQNAADAAAHAGATALACDAGDRTNDGPVKATAVRIALANDVWGRTPALTASDVRFSSCPDGFEDGCVRADVFADQAHDRALPAYFGQLFGLAEQSIRATATAEVVPVNATDCLRPWAVPDKWIENHPVPGPWVPGATFDTVYDSGPQRGEPLPNPDVYVPPGPATAGTGFRSETDCGRRVVLKESKSGQKGAGEGSLPLRIPRRDGGQDYRENIVSCNLQSIAIGSTVRSHPGGMQGPTRQGVERLIAQDPGAYWDGAGRRIRGGCMEAGTCLKSPRLVAIPVFDIALYKSGKQSGQVDLVVRNILGFFVEGLEGSDVIGYLTLYPGLQTAQPSIDRRASFLKAVMIVR